MRALNLYFSLFFPSLFLCIRVCIYSLELFGSFFLWMRAAFNIWIHNFHLICTAAKWIRTLSILFSWVIHFDFMWLSSVRLSVWTHTCAHILTELNNKCELCSCNDSSHHFFFHLHFEMYNKYSHVFLAFRSHSTHFPTFALSFSRALALSAHSWVFVCMIAKRNGIRSNQTVVRL